MQTKGWTSIKELVENKELKIEGCVVLGDRFLLYVTELNSANRKLEGTVIEGKKVYIKKIIS